MVKVEEAKLLGIVPLLCLYDHFHLRASGYHKLRGALNQRILAHRVRLIEGMDVNFIICQSNEGKGGTVKIPTGSFKESGLL
jgi:hypothetical protein